MDKEKESKGDIDRAAIIDSTLPVIRLLGLFSAVTGLGCLACGIATVVLSVPLFEWPFTSGSGIWTGICVLMQGVCGCLLVMNFNRSFPQASKGWVMGFYTCGIIGLSVAPQHLSYSIMCLASCASRSKNDKGEERCNVEHHTSLMALQVFGIVFAMVYEAVAISTLVFMLRKRRLAILTGNPFAGRCVTDCCPNRANYNDI